MNLDKLELENILENKYTEKLKEIFTEAEQYHFIEKAEIDAELEAEMKEKCDAKKESSEENDDSKIEESVKHKVGDSVSVNLKDLDEKQEKAINKILKKNDDKVVIISIEGDEAEVGANRKDIINSTFIPTKSLEK